MNDPVQFVDPSGLLSWQQIGGGALQIFWGTVGMGALGLEVLGEASLLGPGALVLAPLDAVGAINSLSELGTGFYNLTSGFISPSGQPAAEAPQLTFSYIFDQLGIDSPLGKAIAAAADIGVDVATLKTLRNAKRDAKFVDSVASGLNSLIDDLKNLIKNVLGGSDTVGGSCTLAISGTYYYTCGGENISVSFVAIINIPGRDCTAQDVEDAVAAIGGSGPGGGPGGGGPGVSAVSPPSVTIPANCNLALSRC